MINNSLLQRRLDLPDDQALADEFDRYSAFFDT